MDKKQSVKNYMNAKQKIEQIAREKDLTFAQLELLLNLWATGDFTPLTDHPAAYPIQELNKRSIESVQKLDGRSPSSVSTDLTALSRLDNGYVAKGVNPYAQKSRYVSVTEKGDALCQAVSAYFA